jgi:hypothetical protein
VDGAGADHDEQAVIALLDDLDGFIAAGADGQNSTLGLDGGRRDQLWNFALTSSCRFSCFDGVLKRLLWLQRAGWARKKNDSPRGSQSEGTGATAEGRNRGLKERRGN